MTDIMKHCILFLMLALAFGAYGQRRITPIKNPDNTPVAADSTKTKGTTKLPDGTEVPERPASVVEMKDMHGHVVLVDTISGVEYRDTILTQAPKLIYPFMDAVSAGVNLWDPVMRALGQKYGLIGFWGELSIHNWFKPYVEIGLGMADNTPKDENYTYKSSMAPYFKIGLNYNFLYNSNPDYTVYLGLRYGMTHFNYQIDNVIIDQGYWDENQTINVPKQTATVGYAEFLVGLRVMIYKNFYLGWELKAHTILHKGSHKNGNPWYIPGYGTDPSLFTGSFSLSYRLPLDKSVGKKSDPVPPGADKESPEL